IQPDILVCRTERPLSEELKRKIAQFCNVDFGCVVESPDVKSIYEIPLKLHEQGLDREVCMRLHLETKEPDLRAWAQMVEKILNPADRVRIAVVGKYTELADSYKSIHEALVHGGIANQCGAQIEWISSDRFTDQAAGGVSLQAASGLPRRAGLRGARGERAASAPLRGVERVPRRARRIRHAVLRALARRLAGRDDRAARSPLVHRLPVPPRAEVST